jgi:hypothetical protein
MYDVLLKKKLTKLAALLQSNIRMSYQQYWKTEELGFPSNLKHRQETHGNVQYSVTPTS